MQIFKSCLVAAALSLLTISAVAVLAAHAGEAPSAKASLKPRVVVTTEPELDDNNALIRYLLPSTDFRTEGLIYASSQFHGTGDGKGARAFFSHREYDRPGLTVCPCTSYRWAKSERFIDNAVEAPSALAVEALGHKAPRIDKVVIAYRTPALTTNENRTRRHRGPG